MYNIETFLPILNLKFEMYFIRSIFTSVITKYHNLTHEKIVKMIHVAIIICIVDNMI